MWKDIKDAPKDGSVIVVPYYVKWKPYAKTSEQFKSGIKGRWQTSNGYGGGSNIDFTPSYYAPQPLTGDK